MQTKNRTARAAAGVVLAAALALLAYVALRAEAAGLTPPIGFIVRRDCANYALGRIFMSVGVATGTTEVAASGLTATDHLVGMVNASDPSEAQVANASLTAASDKVTVASGVTNGEYYIVIWVRPLKNGQTSW